MRLEKYKVIANTAQNTFEFMSEGPKGSILKVVEYTKVNLKGFRNLYNLGFGDKDASTDAINDLVVTDNQDSEKVLATVASTVYIFTKYHPTARIILTGSTPARTRLYRMAISKYLEELSETFDIKGMTETKFEKFKKNRTYFAFLIKRKIK